MRVRIHDGSVSERGLPAFRIAVAPNAAGRDQFLNRPFPRRLTALRRVPLAKIKSITKT